MVCKIMQKKSKSIEQQVKFTLDWMLKKSLTYWNRNEVWFDSKRHLYLLCKMAIVLPRDLHWNNACNLGHHVHFDSQHCPSLECAVFISWQPTNSKADKFSGGGVWGGDWRKKPNVHHVARNDITGHHKPSYSS